MLSTDQYSISVKNQKLSGKARFIAAGVFLFIISGFVLLWAAAKGYINLRFWLGVCGFKQRFGLPCPGCGWTHAAQAFITGHIGEAFVIQPAAAFFCVIGILTAIFALHCAVFGIDFGFLKRIFSSAGISILLVAAIIIIMAGWVVTLVRGILENSGS